MPIIYRPSAFNITPRRLRGGNIETLYAKSLQLMLPAYRREAFRPDSTGGNAGGL